MKTKKLSFLFRNFYLSYIFIYVNILSYPYLAFALNDKAQEKLSFDHEIINETSNLNLKSIFHAIFSQKPYIKHENGLINWLNARINNKTGILESFFPTKDFQLKNQGLTIDQAFAGITFLTYNQLDLAKTIGDFFIDKWTDDGYPLFFNTNTGDKGIEKTSYLGHNSWIGIFLCHLYSKTNEEKYLFQAKKIIDWSLKLHTVNSALTLSLSDGEHLPFTKIYSTESNIELYALITNYIKYTDYEEKSILKFKLRQIRFYLTHNAKINNNAMNSIKIIKGGFDEKLDLTQSIDTYSYLILALPQNILNTLKINYLQIKKRIVDSFSVEDNNLKGFDFTDANERKKLKRAPMISFKSSFAAILAFSAIENNIKKTSEEDNDYYEIFKSLETGIFYVKPGHFSIPFATKQNVQIFATPTSYKTPKDGELNKAGSVSSVCWYLFCANKVNPFYFDKIESDKN